MIYLDYASSCPLHPELKQLAATVFDLYGNAQSKQMNHLHDLIEANKKQICKYFDGDPGCLYFTSGATESINTIIRGAALNYKHSGKHIITFETEHSSTLSSVKHLADQGFDVSILPVQPNGLIDIDQLKNTIRQDTILLSLNHVCNETGAVQDLEPLIKLRDKFGFMIHLDACQTIGKTKLSLQSTPVDFMSLSAHKCYGPQGIGAMYIAKNRHITPLILGSNTIRPGTISHALIRLMGEAYALAYKHYETNHTKVVELNNILLDGLNGINHKQIENTNSVPHIINITFPDASESDIERIRSKIYCQISASCQNGSVSHVLQARGLSLHACKRSIRLSLSPHMQKDEIVRALETICSIL